MIFDAQAAKKLYFADTTNAKVESELAGIDPPASRMLSERSTI